MTRTRMHRMSLDVWRRIQNIVRVLCISRTARWSVLGFLACVGALASGWAASGVSPEFRAEATFECHTVLFDGTPSRVPAPAVQSAPICHSIVAATLSKLEPTFGSVTCEAIQKGSSVRETLTPGGTRRVVVRVQLPDASLAQGVALSVAREFVHRRISTDPVRKAILDLASAESAFQHADRLWTLALEAERTEAKVETTGPSEMPTVPAIVPVERRENVSLAEQALDRCRAQRKRIADRYTAQHPAVGSLDSQIRLLENELTLASRSEDQSNQFHVVPVSATSDDDSRPSNAPTVPPMDAVRMARSRALDDLAWAQQQFQAAAEDGFVVDYSEVRAGPEAVLRVGWEPSRWFLVGLGTTLALVTSLELLLGWCGFCRAKAI